MRIVQSKEAANFNCALRQAQSDAIQDLCRVMNEAAAPVFGSRANRAECAASMKQFAAKNKQLALRIRVANAILRIKPVTNGPPPLRLSSYPPIAAGEGGDA